MRRLFWLGLGIGLGVLVVRKVTQAAERLTPTGISQSIGAGLSDLAASIGEFSADVRAAMHEREVELREAVGIEDDGSPTLANRPPR